MAMERGCDVNLCGTEVGRREYLFLSSSLTSSSSKALQKILLFLFCSSSTATKLFFTFLWLHRSKKALTRWRSLTPDADSTTTANTEDFSEENESCDAVSKLIPKSSEVEYLLTELCDTTSIAKFELKLGEFQLHVTRDLSGQSAPPQPPVSTPVTAHTVVETPDSNGSASSQSLALSKPVPSSGGVQTLLDKAADEGLLVLQSPRVGYFRRSRTIKGKRAPPSCKEKDIVKEGQVLCYIEQLGGEIPVESDISGEVVKILQQDGDPVGYGDAVMAVLPSFPGIKKLQ